MEIISIEKKTFEELVLRLGQFALKMWSDLSQIVMMFNL